MSAIPDRSPFKAGDHIQLHGYPGYALPVHQRGFTGRVETYLGGTVLDGTTDDGHYWIEQWGALVPYGTPSDGRCTCCPRPAWAIKLAAELAAGRPRRSTAAKRLVSEPPEQLALFTLTRPT